MIDIKDAIEQSKCMNNISDGGSQCFDFGDVVLVKYSCPTKYLKNGEHTRGCEEAVMEGINEKANDGVNTPRHLAMERLIEGENEICYVLQEKCKGFNCASRCEYGVSYERICSDLEFVLNIPFEHYKKLISDGCKLFEMGYEAKNKNLFYDEQTGFWFIDFLDNDKEHRFDSNDPVKVFKALKHRIPKPIQIASCMTYGEKLEKQQQEKSDLLKYSIKAKTLLAMKSVLPNFEKYEKFYLFEEQDDYKKYLMEEGIVKKDLFRFEEADYEVFQELYELVVNGIMDKIIHKGEKFWSIECNDIRIDSNLFELQTAWQFHPANDIKSEDFEDGYDYQREVTYSFERKMLDDVIQRVSMLDENDNIRKFLEDANQKQAYFGRR